MTWWTEWDATFIRADSEAEDALLRAMQVAMADGTKVDQYERGTCVLYEGTAVQPSIEFAALPPNGFAMLEILR